MILKQSQKDRDIELAKYLKISYKEVSRWPIGSKDTKRILDCKKTILSGGEIDENKVIALYKDYKFLDYRKYIKTTMYTSIHKRPANLFKWLKTAKGKNVLDYGSGVGSHSIICLENKCNKVDLLDVKGPLRKFAEWRISSRNHKNTNFLDHDVKLETQEYDYIICVDALEHILHPTIALEKMFKSLRIGGEIYLLVATPKLAAGHLTVIWNDWCGPGQKLLKKYCKKIAQNLYKRTYDD